MNISPSQAINFLNIHDDEISSSIAGDLFIGKNRSKTKIFKNGTVTKLRDVVALGKMTIASSKYDEASTKPQLNVRNLILFKPTFGSIKINAEHCWILESPDDLKNTLEDLLLEWFAFQRESVNKIGLRTILVEDQVNC